MEKEQVTLEKVYRELKDLKRILEEKNLISDSEASSVLADENLLSEDWLSE